MRPAAVRQVISEKKIRYDDGSFRHKGLETYPKTSAQAGSLRHEMGFSDRF